MEFVLYHNSAAAAAGVSGSDGQGFDLGPGWSTSYSCHVVGTVTGASSRAHANIPHDGFGIRLKRIAPKSWRAAVRLPRPGRWRLVVPNGTHDGFMLPPPATWMPWVEVHR